LQEQKKLKRHASLEAPASKQSVGGRVCHEGRTFDNIAPDELKKKLKEFIGEPLGTKICISFEDEIEYEGFFGDIENNVVASMTLMYVGPLDGDNIDKSNKYALIYPFSTNSAFEVNVIDEAHIEVTRISIRNLVNRLTFNTMVNIAYSDKWYVTKYGCFKSRLLRIIDKQKLDLAINILKESGNIKDIKEFDKDIQEKAINACKK